MVVSKGLLGVAALSGITIPSVGVELIQTPTREDSNLKKQLDYAIPSIYTFEETRVQMLITSLSGVEVSLDDTVTPLLSDAVLEKSVNWLKSLPENILSVISKDDIVPSNYGTLSFYFEDINGNELSIEIGEELHGLCGEVSGVEVIRNDINSDELLNLTKEYLIQFSF